MNHYRIYNNDSKVIAVSSYAGKTVRGVAKCDPRDTFDFEKGKELAIARCDIKIALKRQKRALQCLNEAKSAFSKAQKRMEDMKEYFDDATIACVNADLELQNLEDEMK